MKHQKSEPERFLIPDPTSAKRADEIVAELNSKKTAAEREPIWQRMEEGIKSGELKKAREYVSAAYIARQLDLPISRFNALLKAAKVEPDARTGRFILFDPSRVESIRAEFKKVEDAGK